MLTLRSPAKINLFLQVVGRREDGYHQLASLFQTISLFDTLHFELANRDELTCSSAEIPTDKSNLVLKAVDLFRKKTGISFGMCIHLEKNIPSEAGLGGGSGNAATTLWALNHLFKKPFTESELAAYSLELGSDVPFFFSQGTAFCTGRGEVIQSLHPLSPCPLWIVKPEAGLSTPAVFRHLKLNELEQRDTSQLVPGFLKHNPVYFNDLEKPAFSLMPSLSKIKQELLACGFDTVLMTGSGTAFFCIGSGTPSLDVPFIKQSDFVNRKDNCWY